MREIKFRAWDTKERKMWRGSNLLICLATGRLYTWEYEKESLSIFPKEQFELMQYTGLKDKDGKEVYEGDITKITDPDEDSCCGNEFVYICEVCYGGGDYPTSFTIKNEHFWKTYALLYNERHTREVIGNIYENEGLVKRGK